MPTVTSLGMESCVTGFTQSDKVLVAVRTAFGQRSLVVYLFGRNQQSVLLAQLTQRVRCRISVTDSFPCTSVSFSDSRITVVIFITFCFFLGVFLTEPSVSQLRTARVRARSFGFSGHRFSFGNDKSHRRISPVMAFVVFFGIIIISHYIGIIQ